MLDERTPRGAQLSTVGCVTRRRVYLKRAVIGLLIVLAAIVLLIAIGYVLFAAGEEV